MTFNDISTDGLLLAVGAESASIGTLDISARNYHTHIRAHSKTILSISRVKTDTALKTEIVTASEDKTVRVWAVNYPKIEQVYEFSFASDTPLCVAAHPHQRVVACGFSSGSMRVLGMFPSQEYSKIAI